MRLITLSDKFENVADQVENNESEWRSWFDLEQPEQAPLPNGYSDTMDSFEQMLLIRWVLARVVTRVWRETCQRPFFVVIC